MSTVLLQQFMNEQARLTNTILDEQAAITNAISAIVGGDPSIGLGIVTAQTQTTLNEIQTMKTDITHLEHLGTIGSGVGSVGSNGVTQEDIALKNDLQKEAHGGLFDVKHLDTLAVLEALQQSLAVSFTQIQTDYQNVLNQYFLPA